MGATIFLAADHRGFEQKNQILAFLRKHNLEVDDLGPETYDSEDDYPVFARRVAEAVLNHQSACGILLCGSANGVTIQANRYPGIRAVSAYSEQQARLAREHNNANVICLSSDFNDYDTNQNILMAFLTAPFSEEPRHQRRVAMLDEPIPAMAPIAQPGSVPTFDELIKSQAPEAEPTLSFGPITGENNG